MKFVKMLCVMALVAMISAVAVKADSAPGDPVLTINKPHDPTCPSTGNYTCFSQNSGADPLFVSALNTPTEFVWDGSGTLTELFVDFPAGAVGTVFSCSSVGIFVSAACEPFNTGSAGLLGFVFFGSSTDGLQPCDANGNCSGIVATLEAPEPNSMLLLVSMGLPAIGFARKRWNVRPTA
jgi:hypothetical protein